MAGGSGWDAGGSGWDAGGIGQDAGCLGWRVAGGTLSGGAWPEARFKLACGRGPGA